MRMTALQRLLTVYCFVTGQKKQPQILTGYAAAVFFQLFFSLDYGYVCRGRAFLPLLNVKRNPVAFVQRFKPGCIDS